MEGNLTVLLIESDSDTALSIQLLFAETQKSSVHRYSSAAEALESLLDHQPDLILFAHTDRTSEPDAVSVQLFQHYPSAFILCSLPSQDIDLIDSYVSAGANGIVIKNDYYMAKLEEAVKKALIRVGERQSSLHESPIDSNVFGIEEEEEVESLAMLIAGALQPGETILHYRIEEEIGEGGMGEVYRAEDLKLGRRVAIKVLPPKIARSFKMKQRLAREARAASALNHPNIVTIHAIEEARGLSFIVMENVEGTSLQKLFQSGGIEFPRLLNVGKQIASALNAAHKIGVVHRDIKPANIMIMENDQVKLLDFGLAKWISSSPDESPAKVSDLTSAGVVLGTATYMSPEQTRGESLDERSDIFSLGCVLYQGATGRLPFTGVSLLAVMDAIAKAEYALPSAVRENLPSEFDAIIAKALAKDKADRYRSALELAEDLERVKSILPSGAHSRPHVATDSAVLIADGSASHLTARSFLARPAFRRLAAALFVIAMVSTYWIAQHRTSPPPVTTAMETRIDSLAVLPLRNLSGMPEEEYFADGLTESLIADLAKINKLKVISRTSAMHYKNSNKPLPEIAEELNVDAIVEGSVLRSGNRVRITAQLIHAVNDIHLWAENYERPMGDILSLQNEVSQAIAGEIQLRTADPGNQRLQSNRPVNPEAYEAYLKGRYHWNKRTREGLEKSIEYFREAIDLEPDYAAAYAAMADAWQVMGSMRLLPPEKYLPVSRAAAEKALELDRDLAEAHASLAAIAAHEWRWSEADQGYQTAIRLNPNYATAHQWYAMLLMSMKKCDESIAETEKARNLDPLSFVINNSLTHAYSHCGRHEEALEQIERTREIQPNHPALYGAQAMVYRRMGKIQEAIVALKQETIELGSTAGQEGIAVLQRAYDRRGTRGFYEAMLETAGQNADFPKTTEASFLALLGRTDDAFASLEEAFQKHDSALFMIQFLPELESLRSDPRYADLVRRMGFPSTETR